ncbi:Peptidyl-tRNA hydrolase ArfB [Maioricimonas rarisocia]|uniref:Peptidyl-tRNA hydrolase ArfB n=1 Tax=Maioricimonas rarisocia TaxID=2528026 RepID=A0A517Z5N3_9PLAN|nr:alternative ribosome rescue aminoacyl-tRNA hydrolase ArfB [Maioricimonas rarisocia]QDU37798.1 Peptidyl-tRNA hydrolase ArfB [Maioricimonas rarisocia]
MSSPPTELIVNRRIRIPLSEFEFIYSRSSGPGGQNVNKLNTRVQLRWRVTETASLPEEVRARLIEQNSNRITTEGDLMIASQRFREQKRNQRDCLDRLQEIVEKACHRRKVRRPTRTPRRAHERRLSDKKKKSERKQSRRRPGYDD